MTSSQEKLLAYIKQKVVSDIDPKFRAGAEEHGDNLIELPQSQLIDYAIEEALDQVVYLYTLRCQLLQTAGVEAHNNGLPDDDYGNNSSLGDSESL